VTSGHLMMLNMCADFYMDYKQIFFAFFFIFRCNTRRR